MKSRTNSLDIGMIQPSDEIPALPPVPTYSTAPAAPHVSPRPPPPLKSAVVAPASTPSALPPPVAYPPQTVPSSAAAAASVPPNKDPNTMSTLPSSLTANHATFQMDLLNKGGRIGIYLPEARKARIAKFHSKRKMRIWRKRIKYDCRKKLADSRPRIKGRFVKRTDMSV